ncbi:MAG: hypothetical protein L6V81_08110 [Clostridium sp.]|nr:MAG: hypothetical protein L6V81_08110 [Clostridium sp.]
MNDTLIVIAPDHYPYGLTTKQMNEISTIDRNDKFEKNSIKHLLCTTQI